jgi:hypothetical protein
VSDVLGADHAAQSFSSSDQFVFEFPHAVQSGARFRSSCIAFSEKVPIGALEVGDASDEFGALRALDLGSQLEPEAVRQLVPFGSQSCHLGSGQREVGP